MPSSDTSLLSELAEVIKELDRNNDGKVDFKELRKGVGSFKKDTLKFFFEVGYHACSGLQIDLLQLQLRALGVLAKSNACSDSTMILEKDAKLLSWHAGWCRHEISCRRC